MCHRTSVLSCKHIRYLVYLYLLLAKIATILAAQLALKHTIVLALAGY